MAPNPAKPARAAGRSLAADAAGPHAEIHIKTSARRPAYFVNQVDRTVGKPKAGDLVVVYGRDGEQLGYGYFNPKAEMLLRSAVFGADPPGPEFWTRKLTSATALRRTTLRLDASTNSYRVVHAEADGLPGFVADKFGDVLSVEVFSLALWQRAEELTRHLLPMVDCKHFVLKPGPATVAQEGFGAEPISSEGAPNAVLIEEFGTRFRVRFAGGHKTGFFCDQRDNRRRLAELAEGRTVLDLCCYTGGFAVQAKAKGKAAEVIGVDIDAEPLAWAKENANLNQCRVQFAQSDAFAYMRDVANRRFDVVVLDPPKLIRNRGEYEEGVRKHYDLNRLAFGLVAPGGLILTCSCAGLLQPPDFAKLVFDAARRAGRDVRLIESHGAAPDHPVSPYAPDSEYLKSLWLQVE